MLKRIDSAIELVANLGHCSRIGWPVVLRNLTQIIESLRKFWNMNAAKIDEAFEALKTFDWGNDRAPLAPIEQAAVAAKDAAAQGELEQKLLAALGGNLNRAGKDFVCRLLVLVGSAKTAPVLAKWLGSAEDAQLARFALERIPGSEVRQVLTDALSSVKGDQLLGVISSLGARFEPESIPALVRLLSGGDEKVAVAAASALGDIRGSEAAKALAAAKPGSDAVRLAVTDARMSCAEGLLAAGKSAEALLIYKSLTGD
jgi:HEAT repeat protein